MWLRTYADPYHRTSSARPLTQSATASNGAGSGDWRMWKGPGVADAKAIKRLLQLE
jgi:hypothetical protein